MEMDEDLTTGTEGKFKNSKKKRNKNKKVTEEAKDGQGDKLTDSDDGIEAAAKK